MTIGLVLCVPVRPRSLPTCVCTACYCLHLQCMIRVMHGIVAPLRCLRGIPLLDHHGPLELWQSTPARLRTRTAMQLCDHACCHELAVNVLPYRGVQLQQDRESMGLQGVPILRPAFCSQRALCTL